MKIPPEIRAIFFDAVGTLLHPDPPAARVYFQVGQSFGSQYTQPIIVDRFARAFSQEESLDRQRGWSTSEERERQRWENIVKTVLDDISDGASCFQVLYQHFSRSQAWRIPKEAGPVLNQLARQGYRLGLASNFDHRLPAVAAGFAELKDLHPLVISSEVGWRKPSPAFFSALCERVDLPPDHILYVGDDPVNDYQGGKEAGLRVVLFDGLENNPGFSGLRVTRLEELCER